MQLTLDDTVFASGSSKKNTDLDLDVRKSNLHAQSTKSSRSGRSREGEAVRLAVLF